MITIIDTFIRTLLIRAVTAYQAVLSPDHSFWARIIRPYGYCRFHPTCSNYAKDALSQYSTITAGLFIFKRLLRCHPWSQGGFDYLPSSTNHT